ncbi:hypothetical protein JW962_01260 [Candidatus Dojkabacteria bacterium]|nr:hypothetical protein [Candidatus Dojkabacteria bacterium]
MNNRALRLVVGALGEGLLVSAKSLNRLVKFYLIGQREGIDMEEALDERFARLRRLYQSSLQAVD